MVDQIPSFPDIFDHMLEGCQIIDFEWRYLYLNEAAVRHARLEKAELIGRRMMEVYPGIDSSDLFAKLSACMQERCDQKVRNEFVYPDHSLATFDLFIRPVPQGIMILSLDVSEQVREERQVRKLNRVYAVLSDINQAIVRLHENQALYEKACQIAVETGGFRLACLGVVDDRSRAVIWQAQAGPGDDLPDWLVIELSSAPGAASPLASALRSREAWVINRLADTATPEAWQPAALERGCQSIASFPLVVANELRGVFSLFSSEADFFDSAELKLLTEMAMDLSFAMEFIEREKESKLAENRLRASEVQFRTLIDSAPLAISLSRESRFLYANSEYLALHGIASIWDLIGHTIFERVAPQSIETSKQRAYRRARGLPVDKRYELTGLRMDGSEIPLLAAVTQVNLVDGPATVGFFQDISERKQNEEKFNRLNVELEQRVQERTAELSDLYNNAPCGYHSLDSQGLIIRINDTELHWMGYTREEVIGKLHITDLFTPASVQVFKQNFPTFLERGWIDNLEFELVRKDGSILPVLLSGTAVKDAQGRYLMSRSTMIDYTLHRESEKAVRETQARLEAANQELEAFAYSVSHDLRAPLRAIDGFSGILVEDYAGQLDEEANRLLNVIRASTQKMDRLISDLLAFSRLSRIDLRFSRIDMTGLVRSVYMELATPEVQQKFDFTVEPLPEAFGDPSLIHQVWVNLLSNAIKYTLPKEEHRIAVSGRQESGANVYTVKDSGVGFNQEYAHKLFGVFQRLHKMEEFEGTGVGLAIVQRIVHRHGGLAWAEGKINQGAVFHFSLPQREPVYELHS